MFRIVVLLCAILVATPLGAVRAEPRIVTSIKPVHALVSGLTAGIGIPHLIVRGRGSPHGHRLKPSDAKALEQAELVFWIGPELETFLTRSLASLARRATIVELGADTGLQRFKYRSAGIWTHPHSTSGRRDRFHSRSGPGDLDMHVWLDPENARVLAKRIARVLIKTYPEHRELVTTNARKLSARLDALSNDLTTLLEPVRDKPFIVFHDAFQYLEKRYGLNAVGSITIGVNRQPGVDRIRLIRARIRRHAIVCVFAEPQFAPKLTAVIVEGTKARAGRLDPLGTGLPGGADFYFNLMRHNARALADCLGGTG